MSKLSSAALVLALGALASSAERAQAFGLPGCDLQVGCVEKTVICYRPEMRCRQVPCVVEKKICREVCETQKVVVPIPYTEMQKREVFVYKVVPEEVTREVFVAVECPTCESGCGCGHGHCCKPNPATYKKTIKCMECKEKADKVEISEPVCKVRTEEKLIQVKKTVVDVVQETVMKTEYYCEMVPFEVKVPVPVCAPPCGCGCKH